MTNTEQTLAVLAEWARAERSAWETWQNAKEVWEEAKVEMEEAARQQATEEEAKHSKEMFQLSQDSALLSWILAGGDAVYEAMNDPATVAMSSEELKAFLLLAKVEDDFNRPVTAEEAQPDVDRQN